MHLHGALPDQEQAATDENDVAPGEGGLEKGEQRFGHADDVRQHQQQADAHEHRQEQPHLAGEFTLLFRQLVNNDRDEDDVVDTQYQFQRGQGEKSDPDFRIEEEVHDGVCEKGMRGR